MIAYQNWIGTEATIYTNIDWRRSRRVAEIKHFLPLFSRGYIIHRVLRELKPYLAYGGYGGWMIPGLIGMPFIQANQGYSMGEKWVCINPQITAICSNPKHGHGGNAPILDINAALI